ncbi:MAG TPA: acylphosphatase [Ignavibacteria bacterium]|nr:acylphosphatase [Ignavibacteria bacterium]HMR40356.1 acylphosphatase [Ignavibacteria bacterium]
MHTVVKITVNGLVQGVGYRYFCYRKAAEYSIMGYAKNLIDGSVEIVASGEKELVSDFIKEIKVGPVNSFVKSVHMEDITSDLHDRSINYYKEFKML